MSNSGFGYGNSNDDDINEQILNAMATQVNDAFMERKAEEYEELEIEAAHWTPPTSIPNDTLTQLNNAKIFAERNPNCKFTFKGDAANAKWKVNSSEDVDKVNSVGYCMLGYLFAGNGVNLNVGDNILPDTKEGYSDSKWSVFNESVAALNKISPAGSIWKLNDTPWMNQSFAVKLFTAAMNEVKGGE